jgi:hypothetical protein
MKRRALFPKLTARCWNNFGDEIYWGMKGMN